MERFISISPELAANWFADAGKPTSIRGRNSGVAILASFRDALREPRRVLNLATGRVDALPWTIYDGKKIPLVGVIPQPKQWANGPHSEAYEGRARVLSDALSEVFRELAITGQLVPRTAPSGTAPGGAAVPFDQYVGKVGVMGDVLFATIPERAAKGADEPQLIVEDIDLMRRVREVLFSAQADIATMVSYLRDPTINAAMPAHVQALSSNAVVTEMAQRAINAQRAGNMAATVFFTACAFGAGLMMQREQCKTALKAVITAL